MGHEPAPAGLADNFVPRSTSIAKRLVDIVVGVPLCVLVLPFVLVLCLILLHRFRANPVFVHKRIGRRGKLIPIPKLRTLPPDTHPYADKTVVDLRAPTRFISFLRSRHLDELPQLYLVPIGRLSLVGPRPRMVAEAEGLGDAAYNVLRTSLRQGCTGLWQVGEDTCRRVSDHPEYDLMYLLHGTVRLDLWILWRTLYQALGGEGVRLEDIPRWLWRDHAAFPAAFQATGAISGEESLVLATGL